MRPSLFVFVVVVVVEIANVTIASCLTRICETGTGVWGRVYRGSRQRSIFCRPIPMFDDLLRFSIPVFVSVPVSRVSQLPIRKGYSPTSYCPGCHFKTYIENVYITFHQNRSG